MADKINSENIIGKPKITLKPLSKEKSSTTCFNSIFEKLDKNSNGSFASCTCSNFNSDYPCLN